MYNLCLSMAVPSLVVALITINTRDNQFTKERWLGGSQFQTIELTKLVYGRNALSTSHILARTKKEKNERRSHNPLGGYTPQ